MGTSLYADRAIMDVTSTAIAQPALNCTLNTDSRRRHAASDRIEQSRPEPSNRVIPFSSPAVFYFDFLEAAVLSDVPDALAPRTNVSPALDFDTDHTYKLPPARILWILTNSATPGP